MLYNSAYNDLTDTELVQKYRDTNNTLFVGIVYKRYSHLVLGLCIKYLKNEDEAKDMVMHIFEKLFTDLHKHTIQYFKSWLYVYTKNYCLMELRKKQSKLHQELKLSENHHQFMENYPENHLTIEDKEERILKLEEAIKLLNKEQQVCIELFYLKDKSYTDIVEITGYSLNEVKSYIQNGKRNLKLKLESFINEQ